MDRDKILETIKKLLAHANDGGVQSEAEIEAYMGKARKLMDEYDVEDHEVLKREPEKAEVGRENVYDRQGTLPYHAEILGNVPAILFDCRAIKQRVDGRTVMSYVGLKRDVAVAIAMYHELLTSMKTVARVRYPWKWSRVHVSYCLGFAQRLVDRAKTMRTQPAIVLCKSAIVQAWIDENLCMRESRERRTSISDPSAFTRGMLDADGVSLGVNGLPDESMQ